MNMLKGIKRTAVVAFAGLLLMSGSQAMATEVILFSETFDNVTEGFTGSDPRRFGIPTQASFDSDENWYGARFEEADGGSVADDIGVQSFGGSTNTTQVGLVEDDAGLIFRINASMYTDVLLSFDWRTFSASDNDRLRVGYFVGDITAGNAGFVDRQIDLRDASQGGTDGDFNWTAGWVELASFSPDGLFSSEMFSLSAAAGEAEVWIGFWLDGGEGDFGKIDNVLVTAVAAPIPVPAAVWLFGSALLGWFGIGRKNA